MSNKELFTVVKHGPKVQFNLSFLDYCLIDTVYHLANNTSNKKGGWCYKSKEHLAEQFGVSRTTVQTSIKRLMSNGWVKKNECGHLRVTKKWNDSVVNRPKTDQGEKKQGPEQGKEGWLDCSKTGHYSYSNKDSDKGFSVKKLLPSSVKVKKETLVVLESFANIYKAEYRYEPHFGVKEVYCVQNALKTMDVKDALQLVEDWFNSPKVFADVRPQIAVAFSNNSINKWNAMLF